MSQSVIEPPFKPPQSPTQFSAIGYLFGQFETVLPADEHQSKLKGSLQLFDGTKLPARVGFTVWQRLSSKGNFNLDNAYLWRVYFRTTKESKLCQIQLIKCVSPLENYSSDNPPPPQTGLDQFQIRGRILDTDEQKVVIRLERNETPPPGQEKQSRWQPFLITVSGSLPGAEKGQFWELLCIRKGEEVVLKQANLIDETIAVTQTSPTSVQTSATNQSKNSSSKSSKTSTDSTSSPVIMINGRQPEMTVKFTTRPNLPEQGKTVTLEVSGEGGITVRASLNRKTLKKQVEKMDSFADWIAALSGKVARIGSDGVVELEGAGVTVFEKKTQKVEEKPDA
ncbi:hypothetical protein PCC7424_2478 [Gloeothece citriformis PCC 7424]|uniref:Uncharacterized protein n=1 Tax=Gloeothece citriformis (strain PCC 7424) TaxID=65393 RepID=B7KK10_GLOC7|nr:hypothetical protein [Gloeothece citriformis]ACK70895.1 hypothetical protein PCC7424_2478 [Gloeothece citriformis PCC 7424]